MLIRRLKELTRALTVFLVAVAVGLTASPARAQETLLRPGVTVRFAAGTSDTLHVGVLARATPDSLFLDRCLSCDRLSYSRIEVNRLGVLHPAHRGSRFVSGFGLGGLAGLGLGALVAMSCHGPADRCEDSLIIVPFGGLLGGLIGGLAGYLTAYSWDPVRP